MKHKRRSSGFRVVSALIAAGIAIPLLHAARSPDTESPPTARQIVDRIKGNVTCEWQNRTVDTFKAGEPDTPVTGIACTFMATYDVLRRVVASGCNFIITHEPTFYNGQDDTSGLDPDPIIQAKRDYIREHKLIIWRFHDHWHRTNPDGIVKGMIDVFGWGKYRRDGETLYFDLPKPVSLRDFATDLEARFEGAVFRIVGDPNLKFTKLAFTPGAPSSVVQMKMLQRDDVEVLVAGETREWETVEYVRDAMDMGRKKAVIIMGHCISEEAGMRYCADWLSEFVPDVPIKFVPAGNPFWTP